MNKIEIDDFAKIKYLSNPTYSPNGKNFCYTVTNANKEMNRYDSYIYAIKDGKTIRLTGLGREAGFQFLDDETILFGGNRDFDHKDFKGSKFYTLSLNGGEAEEALSFPIRVSRVLPLCNGDYLALGKTDPKFPDLYKGDKEYAKKYAEYLKGEEDYEVIEENPWWFNGGTFTRGARTSMFYYHATDKTLERLTGEREDIGDVQLTNDKKYAFYTSNTSEGFHNMSESVLYRMDLETKEVVKVLDREVYNFRGIILADSFAYLLANKKEFGMNTNPDFYKLSYEDFAVTKICDYGNSVGGTVGSDVRYGGGRSTKVVGDTLYFITTIDGSALLYKLEGDQVTPVIDAEGSVESFDIVNDQLTLVGLYNMKPQELYDCQLNQLTTINEAALEGKYVAQPEQLNFQSDVDEIHGWVLKPIDFDPTKKYPVIIDIHGGPKTVYGPVFYHEMQYWASEGFFVVYCNPTGSDGRGNAFADIRGKYGTQDFADLMHFCDEVLKAYPQMDAENFFETGGSYGGFMTNWIIGHTDRFKACASQRSISNWFSFYGVADIGIRFAKDQNQADPWGNPEKLWWHSPMKYADQVKTPTLFIHSNEDYRCPMPEGMQMFTSLIDHGVETKLVYFKGENHELSRGGKPLHRIRRIKEITEWFKNHLG